MRRVLGLVLALGCASGGACTRHATPERRPEARDADGEANAKANADVDANAHANAGEGAEADAASDAGSADGGVLDGYPALFELMDGDEKVGFVAVPLGARGPRPMMIALHGGSERPDLPSVCPSWRAISEGYAFVVCPRGFGGNARALGWRGAADTQARIERAVDATKRTFGAWVKDTKTLVLTGFSMGGAQVALLAGERPAIYRRVVVGDSAHDPGSSLRFSAAWVKGGGERAVFLCTTSGCEPSLRAASTNVAARGGHARLDIAPTQVHGLSGPVVQSMRRDWAWLVEGAEGWEGYVAPADPSSLPGRTESFGP